MDKELLAKILDGRKELKSLPQTLAEVVRLTRDDSSTAQQLASVLAKDPTLSAKVLRVVNSPYYGLPRQVSSIQQAVMVIGQRQLIALTLSTSVYNLANSLTSSLDRLQFWRHSLETAIACRLIGEKVFYRRPEELYIAGLLHDLGLLILEGSFPAEFPRVWKNVSQETSLCEREEEVWGTNHALVGQFLLEQWHLPEGITLAVGRHHAVFTPNTRHEELIGPQIVALAHCLGRFRLFAGPDATNSLETKDILSNNLGLKPVDLTEIERQLFTRTIEEGVYLEIDLGSIDDLLAEANRLLFEQYVAVESVLRENRQMQQQLSREQIKHLSADQLITATEHFAEQTLLCTQQIATRAKDIRIAIEQGSIRDPQGVVVGSINEILQMTETVLKGINTLTTKSNESKQKMHSTGRIAVPV